MHAKGLLLKAWLPRRMPYHGHTKLCRAQPRRVRRFYAQGTHPKTSGSPAGMTICSGWGRLLKPLAMAIQLFRQSTTDSGPFGGEPPPQAGHIYARQLSPAAATLLNISSARSPGSRNIPFWQ